MISPGQVNSGYRIRNGQWTEIGRQSPKLPEVYMIYIRNLGELVDLKNEYNYTCRLKKIHNYTCRL